MTKIKSVRVLKTGESYIYSPEPRFQVEVKFCGAVQLRSGRVYCFQHVAKQPHGPHEMFRLNREDVNRVIHYLPKQQPTTNKH